MSWIDRKVPGSDQWDIDAVDPPWGDRPSIYDAVKDQPADRLRQMELPDKDQVPESALGTASLDAVVGHHFGGGGKKVDTAVLVVQQLFSATRLCSAARVATLYGTLAKANAIDFVDPLIEAVVSHDRWNEDRLYAIARWLVRRAPDREPVKVGLALLGLFRRPDSEDLLITMGRHEEFTLYAAVALQRTATDHEVKLWQLAKDVDGWGRIHIVERLSGTENKEIQHWLLREGCEEIILPQYTALICAETGKLAEALAEPDPDPALLRGAQMILSALIRKVGPFDGIESYDHGALAVSRYVAIVSQRDLLIADFLFLYEVKRFLEDDGQASRREGPEWQRVRAAILSQIEGLVAEETWRPQVIAAAEEAKGSDYYRAVRAAEILGLDVWDIQFRRLKKGEDVWYQVLQTKDPERIEQVVRFAEATLPLADMTGRPTRELVFGAGKVHKALNEVLSGLSRCPELGRGGSLILTGLRSSYTNNRVAALHVLKKWPVAKWPPGAAEQLRQAAEDEPREKLRAWMEEVLAGHDEGSKQ